MYLIKFYDAEVGDLTDVKPAQGFDDAVADVLNAIGASNAFSVSASWVDGIGSLQVQHKGVTLASIEDVASAMANISPAVTDACNAMAEGKCTALVDLFDTPPSDSPESAGRGAFKWRCPSCKHDHDEVVGWDGPYCALKCAVCRKVFTDSDLRPGDAQSWNDAITRIDKALLERGQRSKHLGEQFEQSKESS